MTKKRATIRYFLVTILALLLVYTITEAATTIIGSNFETDGNLTVGNNATLQGDAIIAGDLSASSSVYTDGYQYSNSSSSIESNLRVVGIATTTGKAYVAGIDSSASSTVQGTLKVTGSATTSGFLDVAGFDSSASSTVQGTLKVTGDATTSGHVYIAGDGTDGLDVNASSTIGANGATTTVPGGLEVYQDLRVASTTGDGTYAVLSVDTASSSVTIGASVLGTSNSMTFTNQGGQPEIQFKASDGDASEITINTSDRMLFENASGGYYFDNAIKAGTNFRVTITENPNGIITLGSTNSANTSIAGNTGITFKASDSDLWNITINTSDQALFTGATGGYLFDAAMDVNASSTIGVSGATTTVPGNLQVDGTSYFTGKIDAPGGVDPPYVSYSLESHESIKEFSKEASDHEEVMMFWNGEQFEVYNIEKQEFSPLTNVWQIVKDRFSDLGVTLKKGVLKVAELVVGAIRADSIETDSIKIREEVIIEKGFTMKDEITNEYYCVKIRNGDFVKEKGKCE